MSRFAWRGTARPRSAIATGSASSTTGICATKIARHENAQVSSPPITGPSAAPATPAAAHRRTPARSAPVASTSSSRLPTITSAPAAAWAARAAISTPSDGATAHTVVAAAKPITPPAVAVAGSPRTHTRAAGTATSASTRLNAIRTHATCPTSAPKSRRISGNANVTTPESPSTTATASDSAATAPARVARGPAAWSLRSALIRRNSAPSTTRAETNSNLAQQRSRRSGRLVSVLLQLLRGGDGSISHKLDSLAPGKTAPTTEPGQKSET